MNNKRKVLPSPHGPDSFTKEELRAAIAKGKSSMIMIDPPTGWLYGFPKAFPEDVTNVDEWLVKNGYPQEEVDCWADGVPCRFWEVEEWK